MKPDGSGQFTAGELQGIDFRVQPGEGQPAADNETFGVAVGIAKAEICSVNHSSSIDERKYGIGAAYRQGGGVGASRIGYVGITGSHKQESTNSGDADMLAYEGSFEFQYKDVDEVGTKYATIWSIGANDYAAGNGQYLSNTSQLDPSDKIYLWVQPWTCRRSSWTKSGVIRTGGFKVWYRLRYTSIGREPNWIEGRVNNRSGVSTDRY